MRAHKILAAKTALLISLAIGGGSLPAQAGIPVIDGGNLTQNVMTAIESVAQTLKQIEQYQTQLQQYENQLQNTMAPAAYIWDQATRTMDNLRSAMNTLDYYQTQLGSLDAYLGKFQDVAYYRGSPCFVDVGFMIWKQAVNNLSAWSPVDSLVGVVLSAAIMLLLGLVAVNMLLMLVAAWLMAYAGIFFLGFGGSRWTSDMAINYYKTVLGVAVQIMTMVLLVGIGNDMLSTFYTRMNQNVLNFEELGVMLVFCMALLSLVNRVPPMVAGIVTGSSIGSAGGIGNFGTGAAVGAVMGAAGMAAGAASVAGSAVMGGAANLAGGGSAIKAAFDKAQASMSSGSDMPRMGGMSSSSVGSGGANSGDGSDTGSTPFAQAAGFGGSTGSPGGGIKQAASLSVGAAGNLVKGAGSMMAEKLKERVADTAGGRLASTIRESSHSFGGNSLGGESDGNTKREV
jgi:P-type conjugative transfer protein TrbL